MSLQGKNVLTFILAGGKGSRLYPLTRDRSKPAVPFAARFRIIDYVLSSCINSGLRQLYVLTQTKSLSLEKHLRIGWNFLAHELAEFIATVPAQQRISEQWYQGTADAIFQNLHLLEDHKPDHVLILSGDHIYNMDFNEIYSQHLKSEADLTISVIDVKKTEADQFGVLTTDSEMNITSFIEKPQDPSLIPGDSDDCHISMGIYLFKTEVLVKKLAEDARKETDHDFGKNIIPSMLNKNKVKAFLFPESRFGDYWQDVGTIKSYYEANMKFLDQIEADSINTPDWRIRTIGEQLPSAHYGGKNGVKIIKSSIGSGSRLSDCEVINSLIGRNVIIKANCRVENSIIMADCIIEENCHINKTIIDTNVIIPQNQKIGINPKEDKKLYFISDDLIVVPKNFRY